MRRRTLLSSLAAGTAALAGCAFASGDDPDDQTTVPPTSDAPPTTDDEQTTTSDGDDPTSEWGEPDGFASVVELETGPRTYAFAPTRMHTDDRADVRLWFDRTATAEHPARLRGWLENANDFANTFRLQWIPVVGRTHSRQPRGYAHEARLHFAPTENNAIAETVPDLTRDETGYWRVADVGPWMPDTHHLEAGERVQLEFVLVGEPGMPGRPTGTYEYRGSDETARVAVWDTTSPGPDAESRFAGRSLPAFDRESTVQWYHDADGSTAAFVEPSTERVELDGRVDLEVVNHSHEELSCGHWNLHKLVDGEWFHVGPTGHTLDCRMLHPGARKQWSLRAFNGDPVHCSGTGGCGSGLTRGHLGGGEYAVVAGYGHPADESAALVELVGDPAEVVPTEDASVERDGDTVVVTTGQYGDDEHPADAAFSLTRAVDAHERLIAEQVMGGNRFGPRGSGIRNALAAMADDAERVVVRADERVVDRALTNQPTRRFRFRSQAYEVTRGGVDD
jgi:hypothetical protein